MKRTYLLTFLLASFFIFISFHGIDAHASISGDEVCGSSASAECGVKDIKKIFQGILSTIVSIGLPLLIVFIIYRFVMAWFALQQGNVNAYKEATKKVANAIFGFIIIIAIFGGILLTMLKFFGVQDFPLKLLKEISEAFIPYAHAQTTQLPNPTGITNLYDFILRVLSMVMKFFIYPALIAIWVWTGFSYVLAQGAPEKLMKTHKLLLWAFISTLVVFMTQGFLFAIRGSVQKILSNKTPSAIIVTVNNN